MTEYYHLKHGDIIQEGDEIDACGNPYKDAPKWVPVTSCIGEPAPDPSYISHRQYRRKLSRTSDQLVHTVWRSDDQSTHIFSTFEKAFAYSNTLGCPCVVGEYLVDNPERYYEVTQ